MTENNFDAAAAEAAGVTLEESMMQDYFGFDDTSNFFLPDRKTFVTIKRMNEGAKAKYQRETSSAATFSRRTDDVKIVSDAAKERHALIKACVVGWNFHRKDNGVMQPVPFSPAGLQRWLEAADPAIVELVEKECRRRNPWLLAEMSVEDIDKEIENLQEMREARVKADQGEGVSASK